MKILYITTIGGTMGFFKAFISKLIEEGHTIDIACNDTSSNVPEFYKDLKCNIYTIQTSRSPLDAGNITAIKQIKDIVSSNKYDIVHCHTPIAAMCTRIACRKFRKNGIKVIYTAHGFHFFKGAPLKNWLLYYPVEWICAHWTDTLITINTEDYELAKRKMHAKEVEYVPGVGIDLEKFKISNVSREKKREELGVPADAKLLLSVGEINDNKNHETVIKAIDSLDVYYIIAGQGDRKEYIEKLIHELKLEQKVKLLGFRKDVPELLKASDIYILPSKREGLNVSLMEAMASGLPCAVGAIRGNTDLIDENGGVLFNPYSVDDCRNAIQRINQQDNIAMGIYNKEKVEKFSKKIVLAKLEEIYERNVLGM